MSLITWQTQYEIGVEAIDEQHRSLVALINKLYDARNTEANEAIVKEAIIQLVDYTHMHFRDEENLMKKINYPEYEEHLSIHTILINKVFLLLHNMRHSQSKVADDLLEILQNWFIQHILALDRKVGEFYKSTLENQ